MARCTRCVALRHTAPSFSHYILGNPDESFSVRVTRVEILFSERWPGCGPKMASASGAASCFASLSNEDRIPLRLDYSGARVLGTIHLTLQAHIYA